MPMPKPKPKRISKPNPEPKSKLDSGRSRWWTRSQMRPKRPYKQSRRPNPKLKPNPKPKPQPNVKAEPAAMKAVELATQATASVEDQVARPQPEIL